ncbi:poly(A) RNA polymerase GLD2-A-like [Ruditapes philippinarum]|uniref:poly(A) RNA polymerase GLD2-A-like n=1 Tax=Ruditapes philippinarum TaxID=129788 RepID=UPI00295AFF3C|nr:poly(A) RNA polymerase GLD2-A-like [Ruditapes philippinarum]XP_060579644.1 poly(A) RNA polymerase GLD2-A-like [Ruditapes philippinarum]XP_060579645.1 poly(A) RNA polymerase GLD2-A-like [Ruditapes philippinarum]
MYQRKSSGYRPVRNVPYSSNVVENFLAPAVPQMVYPMVPVIHQPAFGYTRVPQWDQQPSRNFPERNIYHNTNNNNSNSAAVYNRGSQKRSYSQSNSEEYDDYEYTGKKRKSEPVKIPVSVKDKMNDKITEGIWRYFEAYRQTDAIYKAKVDLRDALYVIFKDVFPYSGLYMVGSSMSGFATRTSDMDLCLMLSQQPIDGKREAIEILMAIQKCLRRCRFVRKSQVIRARVPILKFEDYENGVECDLNINNSVGIRNTHLLRYYAAMDWRVRPLVLFTKRWARFHDINDASKKTISSYSLCLMVLHYLQYGCNPPVLESIQKLYPDLFDYGDDIRNLKMNVRIKFKSKNSQSLGDLFLGMLKYYSVEFSFDDDVISVRQGTKLPLHLVQSWTPLSEKNMWKCLKIEEPFDKSNTARSCFDDRTFARVMHVFARSYRQLARTHDLESILSTPY